ncbi:hypothetical protein [Paenibacillus endoradicis]|uniref:hypothetical protein n=1 Tax=Paenibacillus endoradicis TaxID=2972487 RepID=UPI00215908E9|nr:hypothetical protein [Paenibacillus endoradicis]MCR8656625.1 hypothetical protein [Paenibacillus endoradicis]
MKKKQTVRDVIYVSGRDFASKCFFSYGIEFHELMSCVEHRPENLILLKHNFDNAQLNLASRFEYVTSLEIDELIADDVYGYGDFCWVDFNKVDDLDNLNSFQIAELLYFGHLAKNLQVIPKQRFAYYAHDDGWFNKLYVSELVDYEVMLARVITLKLKNFSRKLITPLPNVISKILLEATKEGLFIDFSKLEKTKFEIRIPITAVGHYMDMDAVYNLKDEITDYKIWLVHRNREWRLINEEKDID